MNFSDTPSLIDGTSYETDDGDVLPIADITEPDTGESEKFNRSEEFLIAQTIIEDGIAKSKDKEHGYAELKVEYSVADTAEPTGWREVRMTLAQFFGGNALKSMVDEQDYKELYALYGGSSEAYVKERHHKLGSAAISTDTPHRERDIAERAANDDTLKDDD